MTINGGTVTARGDGGGEDIGGYIGQTNDSKIVMTTITGGRVNASNIVDRVAISGGIFAWKPLENWMVSGYHVATNDDEATKGAYPWAIADNRSWVSPDVPLGPFDTAEKATNAMATAVFAPSEEVAGVLDTSAARTRYAGWFGLGVTSKAAAEWYVEAALTDAAKSNLVETATKVTRQIPVAGIAALEGNATTNVTVTGCEPGFYYTLYGAAALPLRGGLGETALPMMAYRSEPCGVNGEVAFDGVAKPSDAAGFFTVGVSETKGGSSDE